MSSLIIFWLGGWTAYSFMTYDRTHEVRHLGFALAYATLALIQANLP